MVVVAQLVRVSVCGSEGRGFESHHPPIQKEFSKIENSFFVFIYKKKIIPQEPYRFGQRHYRFL